MFYRQSGKGNTEVSFWNWEYLAALLTHLFLLVGYGLHQACQYHAIAGLIAGRGGIIVEYNGQFVGGACLIQ